MWGVLPFRQGAIINIPKSDDTPLEAGLMFTCKMKSDVDFLGRSALTKRKESGAPFKKKSCFTLNRSDVFLMGNEAIFRNGECVGFVRRADFAFYLDKSMAYGYVSRPDGKKVTQKWLKEGSYQIEKMGEKFDATFHTKTPFDPENNRMKGIY